MDNAEPPKVLRVRPIRKGERQAIVNAFKAARMARENRISQDEAAKRCGSNRASLTEAFSVLTYGTPEEIAAVESGEATLRAMCRVMRARVPAAERKAKRRRPIRGAENIEGRELDAAMWARLRGALDAIAGLPRPADVVAIVKKNQRRVDNVNRKLISTFEWITEFSDAWTK